MFAFNCLLGKMLVALKQRQSELGIKAGRAVPVSLSFHCWGDETVGTNYELPGLSPEWVVLKVLLPHLAGRSYVTECRASALLSTSTGCCKDIVLGTTLQNCPQYQSQRGSVCAHLQSDLIEAGRVPQDAHHLDGVCGLTSSSFVYFLPNSGCPNSVYLWVVKNIFFIISRFFFYPWIF